VVNLSDRRRRAHRKERQIGERFCDSLGLTSVCIDLANECEGRDLNADCQPARILSNVNGRNCNRRICELLYDQALDH
jgi:hypothetical protein